MNRNKILKFCLIFQTLAAIQVPWKLLGISWWNVLYLCLVFFAEYQGVSCRNEGLYNVVTFAVLPYPRTYRRWYSCYDHWAKSRQTVWRYRVWYNSGRGGVWIIEGLLPASHTVCRPELYHNMYLHTIYIIHIIKKTIRMSINLNGIMPNQIIYEYLSWGYYNRCVCMSYWNDIMLLFYRIVCRTGMTLCCYFTVLYVLLEWHYVVIWQYCMSYWNDIMLLFYRIVCRTSTSDNGDESTGPIEIYIKNLIGAKSQGLFSYVVCIEYIIPCTILA